MTTVPHTQVVEPTAEVAEVPLGTESYTSLATSTSSAVFFRPVMLEDVSRCFELEQASYPEDEGASLEKLTFRATNASELFMVAVAPGPSSSSGSGDGDSNTASDPVIGFVCGTAAASGRLTRESMAGHDTDGDMLCMHSVVIEQRLRRKGLAKRMLAAYMAYTHATSPHLKSAHLLCKHELVPLYKAVGFTLIGPSDVVHGHDQWLEMERPFPDFPVATLGAMQTGPVVLTGHQTAEVVPDAPMDAA